MTQKHCLFPILLPGLLLLSPFSYADSKDAAPYQPPETTVALIPVINQGGEKNEGYKAKQTENGDKELRKEFTEHGFKIADEAAVTKAIADLKVDLTDEEQQKKDTLYKIGKAANADLVVLAVITDTAQQFHQGILSNSREGKAKVKMWLLDAKAEKPIFSAVTHEGKSGGGFFAGLDKGSARIIIAVANAERDSLKDFFKPYRKVKTGAK